MDEKSISVAGNPLQQKKTERKKFLRYESTGIAAGGTIAMVLEGCAVFVPFIRCMCGLFWQFYVGAAAGGIYTVMKRCTMVQAAQQIDRFRVSGTDRDGIWAYWKKRVVSTGCSAEMPCICYRKTMHGKRRVFVRIEGNLWHFFLSLGLALVLSFVPSPAHKQAQQRHAIRQEAREKEKRNPKSDGCLKTDRHLFHDKRTKESPAGTDTVTGLIAKKKCSRQIRRRHWHLPGRNFPTSMDRRHRFPGQMSWHRYLKNIQVNTNTGNQLAQGGCTKHYTKHYTKRYAAWGIHAVFGNQFPGFRGWGRSGQWKGRK